MGEPSNPSGIRMIQNRPCAPTYDSLHGVWKSSSRSDPYNLLEPTVSLPPAPPGPKQSRSCRPPRCVGIVFYVVAAAGGLVA